jgi:hypothetical protein
MRGPLRRAPSRPTIFGIRPIQALMGLHFLDRIEKQLQQLSY